jgi:hypothetical protein
MLIILLEDYGHFGKTCMYIAQQVENNMAFSIEKAVFLVEYYFKKELFKTIIAATDFDMQHE